MKNLLILSVNIIIIIIIIDIHDIVVVVADVVVSSKGRRSIGYGCIMMGHRHWVLGDSSTIKRTQVHQRGGIEHRLILIK